ncbi:MAG: hypothetical protein NTV73_13835 [Hyphomicrobiales bacterium]|nr:hypothetical protein [Hyphomicrobiales bacterium]
MSASVAAMHRVMLSPISEVLRAMAETPSKSQIVQARLVVALSVAAVIFGLVVYGLSGDVLTRIGHNMLYRPDGPFVFRFVLQPAMATLGALRDGIRDARTGRAPFLWTVLTNPTERGARLKESLFATSRIILLGLAIDTAYQIIEFKTFHPAEAVIIAFLLAFVPYVLLRGLIARIARSWVGDKAAGGRR